MVNYNSLLKTWGDTGTEYPTGYSYLEGEQPVDAWDNFLINNVVKDLDSLISTTNSRIESDKGSDTNFPASPETAHIYMDETNGALHFWDPTTGAWRDIVFDGDSLSSPLTLSDGSTAASQSWVNTSADVPNADTVDGQHASEFAAAGHSHALGDLSDVTATGEGAGGGLDADTVDGQHAADLSGPVPFTDLSGISVINGAAPSGNGYLWQQSGPGTVVSGWLYSESSNDRRFDITIDGNTGTVYPNERHGAYTNSDWPFMLPPIRFESQFDVYGYRSDGYTESFGFAYIILD